MSSISFPTLHKSHLDKSALHGRGMASGAVVSAYKVVIDEDHAQFCLHS